MTFNISYLGKKNTALENDIQLKVKEHLEKNEYNLDEIKSINNYSIKILDKNSTISNKSLDYIRCLCQRYDNKLKVNNFTSHRKYIGKFITLAKKIIFKCVNFSLRNYINQQEEFNACVIKSLISLHNDNQRK